MPVSSDLSAAEPLHIVAPSNAGNGKRALEGSTRISAGPAQILGLGSEIPSLKSTLENNKKHEYIVGFPMDNK